jgi:hypothetical protein
LKKSVTTLGFFFIGCVVATATLAASASIETRGGNELGLTFSSYSYEEPAQSVSITGNKLGVNHAGTLLLKNDWFIRDDLRFAYGQVDYSGSGVQLGAPDWYYEVRGLLGRDFQLENTVYSPYAGFGYRYLFNDVRGYSNTGSAGYRRESNYYYLPLGVTHHFKLQDQAVLSTTLEYDYFLWGEQVTRLSDLIGHSMYTSASDTTNRQNSGYGYRLNMMYEMSDWSFGPFLNVWKIGASEYTIQTMTNATGAKLVKLHEPQNQTTEYGIRVNLRF